MTSLNTCLRSKPQAQAGGANSAVTLNRSNHFDLRDPIATLGYDDKTAARAAMAKVRSRTMVSYAALMSLWEQIRYCETQDILGAYVECGVWKGGVGGYMALANMAHSSTKRPIHLFDAFDNICEPDPEVDGERALREIAAWAGKDAKDLSGKLTSPVGHLRSSGRPRRRRNRGRFHRERIELR